MQDIYQTSLTTKGTFCGTTDVPKKYYHYTFLKKNDVIKKIPLSYKIKVYFVERNIFKTHMFLGYSCPMWIWTQPQRKQPLNVNEDKYCLLTPYPTLMPPLKKFSPGSIRAIAREPNIDVKLIGIYSRSDIQHHIRTQQYQELAKINTIERDQ